MPERAVTEIKRDASWVHAANDASRVPDRAVLVTVRLRKAVHRAKEGDSVPPKSRFADTSIVWRASSAASESGSDPASRQLDSVRLATRPHSSHARMLVHWQTETLAIHAVRACV